jgi:NTP pyrophosphatase (non-canonical NTP hydrolase)
MNGQEYIKACLRTLSNQGNDDLLHGAMGCCTEAGELLDALKKERFYDKSLDDRNLIEELGDLCWYISIIMNRLGVSWEEVWEANIAKLIVRYPTVWTQQDALDRDTKIELEAVYNACEPNSHEKLTTVNPFTKYLGEKMTDVFCSEKETNG